MSISLTSTGITYNDGTTDSKTPFLTMASALAGDLGTYCMATNVSGGYILAGEYAAGSILYYSNAAGDMAGYNYSPPGTWRCMGYSRYNGNPDRVTIWVRYV